MKGARVAWFRRAGRAPLARAAPAAMLAGLTLAAPSFAEEPARSACDSRVRPWIRLEERPSPRALGFSEVLRHVRAELERRGILVCLEGGGEPVAVVAYEMGSETSVEVVVEVRDQVTRKRVSRLLDLGGTPRDARPLAVAIGTDELLTASWAEVALETRRDRPAPPEVTRAVSDRMKEAERRADAGAALAFETYGGGQAFLGVDLRAGYRPFPRLAITGRLVLRRGVDEAAPNGTLGSSAWGGGIGVRALFVAPSRPLAVDALARLDVLGVSYSPDADPGALEHPGQATAVVGSTGFALRVAPAGPLRFGVEALAGTPFREVTASDSGKTVAVVSGVALAFGAEAALVF